MSDFDVNIKKNKKPTGQEVFDMVNEVARYYWSVERESTNVQTEELKKEIRVSNRKTATLIAVSIAVVGTIAVMAVTLNFKDLIICNRRGGGVRGRNEKTSI